MYGPAKFIKGYVGLGRSVSEKMAKKLTVTKKMYVWNLAGCTVNAALSFFMLAFVTWNTGLEETGYFSIALATSQLLLTFGRYGIRAYQVTDINFKIKPGSYVCHRVMTSAGMMALAFLFTCISGYPAYKKSVVLYVCALRTVDAVEDVFHGELQRNGRLDQAGKLLTMRSVLTMAVFGTVICTSRNLILSCVSAWVISMIFFLITNIPAAARCSEKPLQADIYETGQLFFLCFPLFVSQFLSLLIYNMPKYAVDMMESSEMQAVYSIIFMPSFVINMVSEFMFKPLLTPLSADWEAGKIKELNRMIMRLFSAIAVISFFTLITGSFIGIPLLEWFYHTQLRDFKRELIILLAGGAFSAAVYLSYHLLAMMRKTKNIFYGYFLGIAVMTAAVWRMVQDRGIFGAACVYLFVEVVMLTYFCICIKRVIKEKGDCERELFG